MLRDPKYNQLEFQVATRPRNSSSCGGHWGPSAPIGASGPLAGLRPLLVCDGVRTEQNSTDLWVAGYEQNKTQLFSGWRGTNRTKFKCFLGGGVRTEQNSTNFWVAGYEQNSVTHPLTYTELYIYRYI